MQDVSLKKIQRKISADGIQAALAAGVETSCRKFLFTPVLRQLIRSGYVPTASEADLVRDGSDYYRVEPIDTKSSPRRRPFVVNAGEGRVLTTTGAGLNAAGDIIDETVSRPEEVTHKTAVTLWRHLYFDGPRLVYDIVNRRTNAVDERATHTGAVTPMIPRYRNYFHWTIECLPRLRAIRAFEKKTATDVSLLVPNDASGWMMESLALAGVDDDSIQPANATVYKASELVVPSFPEPTTDDCRWLRNAVLKNSSDVSIETGSNIYISRANATERRVLNEDAVKDTLRGYGFRSYRLEELSVAEQAVLFNDADIVLGAHGAGLSNLIYCEDAAVIELFGKKVKPNYAALADTVGIEYRSMNCTPSGVDLIVDTDSLAETVEAVQ